MSASKPNASKPNASGSNCSHMDIDSDGSTLFYNKNWVLVTSSGPSSRGSYKAIRGSSQVVLAYTFQHFAMHSKQACINPVLLLQNILTLLVFFFRISLYFTLNFWHIILIMKKLTFWVQSLPYLQLWSLLSYPTTTERHPLLPETHNGMSHNAVARWHCVFVQNPQELYSTSEGSLLWRNNEHF